MSVNVNILKKMKYLIKSKGLGKGALENKSGQYCIIGSWGKACGFEQITAWSDDGYDEPADNQKIYEEFAQSPEGKLLVESLYPAKRQGLGINMPTDLPNFNDKEDITTEDMVNLLDAAIRNAENPTEQGI